MSQIFDTYVKSIENDLRSGKATEYTYRNALENYMEALGKGINASNDPKHIECGAPDFIVEKGRVPLGYVETKDVGQNLDLVERSEQMKRYLPALHNLILTDYLEFRWYVNGVRKNVLRVAEVGANGRLTVNTGAELLLEAFFKNFYATETPTVRTPKELAQRLAGITRFIRDRIIEVLTSGAPELKAALNQQYATFADLLLPALKPEEFADLYAQAMTYGLFAAKLSAPKDAVFTFEDAYKYLRANPFMQRLFQDVDRNIEGIAIIQPYLQDIVSLLNRSETENVFDGFGRRTRTEDAVVHFYETFLAAYDPKLRESRGIYYTPEPVVQFIVRSVDELLKTRFDKPWGLADGSVKVLDPACGTGTFLYFVIQQIHDEIVNQRKQAGQWPQKSKEMLKRLFGFELLLPPYVVSHLKLDRQMEALGAPIAGGERLHVYLTNSLEEGVERADQFAGLGLNIAQESSEAAKVKRDDDIMVVLGNPPYSGHSANASVDKNGNPNFIGKLIRDYYFVDGAPLGERNPKWLQDDYVKFIRFGEWRINKTGHGILAFITNHGYLDNPTFRGMRQHLMKTFDEIYILDLHGNSKKKEVTPDGKKDENVFDIQQGVAIIIAIRKQKRQLQSVQHSQIWGIRESKYEQLTKTTYQTTDWKELAPSQPFYLFTPLNIDLQDEFNAELSITQIFDANSLGITTARDNFAVAFDKEIVTARINELINRSSTDAELLQKHDLHNTSSWHITNSRESLRKSYKSNLLTLYNYRPFDNRWTYHDSAFLERDRKEIQKNFYHENYGFVTLRRPRNPEVWDFVFVSDFPVDKSYISSLDNAFVFPLYIYTTPEESAGTLFAQSETTRRPNLAPAFIDEFSRKMGLQFISDGQGDLKTTFGPEDVFYYAYAVFHSPTYRTRYAEFLKIDFPRLPLTGDKKRFAKLVSLGKELVEMHLLKSPKVENFITSYPITGGGLVDKVKFEIDPHPQPLSRAQKQRTGEGSELPATGKVWINPQQYFGGVPETVWNFKIGGYQVCDKWLKDRKGRILSGEDISHYQRVVVALKETIRLMAEVDKAIPKWPME